MRRRHLTSPLRGLLIAAAFGCFAALAPCAEFAPGTEEAYQTSIIGFFDRHCLECHDEATAKAGLNLEKLSTKFLSAPSVEWVEIMDAINLGEMPPEEEPRPDPAKSFAVVEWIADQLLFAEKANREAGGQIPMRRLNRDEYANTVRDLLQIDANILAPILEDLPGDGKAEGFDRPGVALFFDQTQLEKTLSAAEQIAELTIVDPKEKPEPFKTRFEPELLLQRGGMGVRPDKETTRNAFANEPGHEIRTGALTHFVENQGVRYVQGFGNRNTMGKLGNAALDELVDEP